MSDAAALAAALAEATRASGVSVMELCEAEVRNADHAHDAAVQARRPAWQALATQVRTSRQDLATMHTALEEFHTQLQRASEHISQLQQRSRALSEQLNERESEATALAEWLETAALPPPVVRLVCETSVGADLRGWVDAVRCVDAQQRVVAAYEAALPPPAPASARAEVVAVAEQCRTLMVQKIYTHLQALWQPIRTSVSTTLPILQFSVVLPHNEPLYHFLSLHAPRIAAEVQLSYVNAVRLYYEVAFRRYVKELKRILYRWNEPATQVAQAARRPNAGYARERLKYAQPSTDDPAVLAYQSEDATFVTCPEHLFHTLALVFLDTACSEYAFLARFFAGVGMRESHAPGAPILPPSSMLSLTAEQSRTQGAIVTRETWRQAMEPPMALWAEFRQAVLALPNLPVLSLLTMARLTQALMRVAAARHCLMPELESALMQHVLEAWPLIAKALNAEVDALQALTVGAPVAPSANAGFLERWVPSYTDLSRGNASEELTQILSAYAQLFAGIVELATAEHEVMLLAGLGRMHTELVRLVREYATHEYARRPQRTTPAELCMIVPRALAAPDGEAPPDTHAAEAAKWSALAEALRGEAGT